MAFDDHTLASFTLEQAFRKYQERKGATSGFKNWLDVDTSIQKKKQDLERAVKQLQVFSEQAYRAR